MNEEDSPLGLVLAGGRSRRMGQDKGLLRDTAGRRWAMIALQKLNEVCGRGAISINADQQETYAREFPGVELIVDAVDVPGPMGALLSAYPHLTTGLLVLAADMVDMDAKILRRLIAEASHEQPVDAVLFCVDERLEPLCAYYARSGLAKLAAAARSERLKGAGLQQLPAIMNVRMLPLDETNRTHFRNYNSPEDLKDGAGPG